MRTSGPIQMTFLESGFDYVFHSLEGFDYEIEPFFAHLCRYEVQSFQMGK